MNYKNRQESATKKGIYGIFWNFSGSIVQIISQLLIISILARQLTPEEFGVVGVILIFVNFSDLFTNMGIGSALIQLKHINQKHISLGYTLSILIGSVVGVLFYFFAPYAGSFFDIENANNAFRFFSVFFPLRSFNGVANALMTRQLRFSIIVKCGIVSYIFGTGLTSIILAYLDYGYWALIYGQFVGLLLSVGIMMYYERPSFSLKFDKVVISDLLLFGTGHTLGTILTYFGENADNIIIGKTFGTVSLGVYSKAYQLFQIPASFFGGIFDKVLFPILAMKQDEKEVLVRFYLFSSSFVLWYPIPGSNTSFY